MKRSLLLFVALFGLFALSAPTKAAEDSSQDGQTVDAITDGYYYVYTMNGQNARAMYVNNTSFCWENLERANARFIFKLVGSGKENEFYMQNLYEGSWWGEVTHYYESSFNQTEKTHRGMLFISNGDGTFTIRPSDRRGSYKDDATYAKQGNWAASKTSGTNKSNKDGGPYVCWHPLSQWTGNKWLLEKVANSELQAAALNVKLKDALEVYNQGVLYTQDNSKIITNVDATADPASGEPSQFFTNCQHTGDKSSSFANLIDGSLANTSRFQSTWETSVPYPQWIQVDVSADGSDKQIEGFQLEIGLRSSTWGSIEQPSEISVYATNDESAAKDLEACTIENVSDNAVWTKIGDYQMPIDKAIYYAENKWASSWSSNRMTRMLPVESNFDDRYVTKNIILNGGKYRFIRFYILNTVVNASNNHDFTMSEMQMYELKDVLTPAASETEINALLELIKADQEKVKKQTATADDITALEEAMKAVSAKSSVALGKLRALIDSIDNLSITFKTGTEPGYYTEEVVSTYNKAYDAAVALSHASLTEEEYIKAANDLRKALNTAKQSVNPVTTGYYNFVNCYSQFWTQMAMTGLSNEKLLGWQKYDINNPAQLFKVTRLSTRRYSIQNVQTGKYIGTISGLGGEVPVTDTQETKQKFTSYEDNPERFVISNEKNNYPYHAEFVNNGANAKGLICVERGGSSSPSAWLVIPVTGAKLDSLLAVAPQENLKAIASHAIDTARAAYDRTFNYKQSAHLITQCDDTDPDNCQWWTTCQSRIANYTSYANLIDGDFATCCQGTWVPTEHAKPQWIQADMQDHPVKDFTLYYGLRNGQWGAWEQVTQITVFVTNDESVARDESIETFDQASVADGWKNMGSFDLPDDQAMRKYTGTNRSFTYDINNVFDQKYRFIRFYFTHTYKPYPVTNDIGTFSIGELNIMENTYDEANAPYFYTEGLKAAADSLKAQQKVVADAMASSTVTQEQIDLLNQLRKRVISLTPIRDGLQEAYDKTSKYINNFAAGEEYGDVTEAEYSAAQTALTKAKAVLDQDHVTAAELNGQISALAEALKTFKSEQKQFEPNKWYYIVSMDTTRIGSKNNNGASYTGGTADTFCYGNCAYAASDNTKDAAGGSWGTNNKNAIYWGYYAAGQGPGGSDGSSLYADQLDPHTMWRLVPIEGKEGQYAIQNRATGLYIIGYTANNWVCQSTVRCPYIFENLGSGQYKFRSATYSSYIQFWGNYHVYPNGDGDDPNSVYAFTLVPVETPENIVIEYPAANSIFVKSLPYAVSSDVVSMNKDFATFYGVKGLEVVGKDSTLLLDKKTSVEAGEPFIVVCGDYKAYNPEDITTTTLVLPAVDEFTLTGKTVNGLTATIDYTKAPKAGLGYFADAVLKSTAAGTGIEGHTGYFDVKNMPVFTTTTAADLRYPLNGSGVDAIKSITAGNDGVVNVYSIDGKLVKKNVLRSKAAKGLGKGIYIVGKKKVSVK